MVKIFNILEGLLPKEEKKDNSNLFKALEEEQIKRANEKKFS